MEQENEKRGKRQDHRQDSQVTAARTMGFYSIFPMGLSPDPPAPDGDPRLFPPLNRSMHGSVRSARGRGSEWVRGGRAGVGQAVLLGLLGGAGLPLRQGRAGVLALGGAALAAEQLALDAPETLPVVEPGERAQLRAAWSRRAQPGVLPPSWWGSDQWKPG